MAESQSQRKIQYGIHRWLESGKKSGFTELESETVTLCSVLGNRSDNQDRAIFLRVKFEETGKSPIAALVLCDGMGGMLRGGDCANLAISTFAASLVNNTASTLVDKLQVAVHDANHAVYRDFQGKGGCTLSAVACNNINERAAVNIGDSRIYSVFNTGTVKLSTVDDTLEKQLADLKLPSPPPEFRQLLQYIGMGEGLEPRQISLESNTDVKWFVITSDGSHDIPESIFESILTHAKTPSEVTSRLTEISQWLGGRDNATVGVLQIRNDLFLHSRNTDPSSLEIWGVPGKAEFFSIKPKQADTFRGEILLNAHILESEVDDGINTEDISMEGKPPRRKSKDSYKKNNPKNVSTENDKSTAQLNIELSSEN